MCVCLGCNTSYRIIESSFSWPQIENDDVREMAMALLSELSSQPLKTIVYNVCDDVFFLSVYTL